MCGGFGLRASSAVVRTTPRAARAKPIVHAKPIVRVEPSASRTEPSAAHTGLAIAHVNLLISYIWSTAGVNIQAAYGRYPHHISIGLRRG